MIKLRKNIILPAALGLSLIGAIIFATTSVGAQSPSPGTQTIIQRIAQRFNLSESDVQAVFDQDKQERHAQKLTQVENQLSADVTSGKITDAQKQLILNKMKELEGQKQNWQGDHSQMKAQMQAKKTELENWAKQNGIDPNYLLALKGHGRMGGHGFKGGDHIVSPTPTAAQ